MHNTATSDSHTSESLTVGHMDHVYANHSQLVKVTENVERAVQVEISLQAFAQSHASVVRR